MKRSRYCEFYASRTACYPSRTNADSGGLPCLGMCRKNEHYNNAYVLMAVIRNTLRNGLLLTFVNTTREDADLYWRDYDGDDVLIVKFKPGQIHRFSAIVTHNFCCQSTLTEQPFYLNDEELLIGKSLAGFKKDHTVLIRPSHNPLPLKQILLSKVACQLGESTDVLRLNLPKSIKLEVFWKKEGMDDKEYYSTDGEPGQYAKDYGSDGEGPLIYPPGLDWSPFEE